MNTLPGDIYPMPTLDSTNTFIYKGTEVWPCALLPGAQEDGVCLWAPLSRADSTFTSGHALLRPEHGKDLSSQQHSIAQIWE